MSAGYETLIVTFSDPIKVLDNMFSDFGGFLILPLKYDPDRLGRARLEALGEPAPVTTADVN